MSYEARVEYESFGDYDADRSMILDNGGHIFERSNVCLWGFPIHHAEALNPPVSILTPRKEIDTWFVWFLFGDLKKVWSLIPYELPLIIFARDDKLHVHSFESLAKRLSR